jgi:hypothetical protein
MLLYAGLLRVGRLLLRTLLVCAERAWHVTLSHVSCVWCCLRLTILVLAFVVLGEFGW